MKSTGRNRNIPIIVRVSDVNDNAPVFANTPYETTVPEVSFNPEPISSDYDCRSLNSCEIIDGQSSFI